MPRNRTGCPASNLVDGEPGQSVALKSGGLNGLALRVPLRGWHQLGDHRRMVDKSADSAAKPWRHRASGAVLGTVGVALVLAGLFEYGVLTLDRLEDWLTRIRWLPTVMVAAGVGVGVVPLAAHCRRRRQVAGLRPSMRPLRWWVIAAAAIAVGVATWAGVAWLLTEADRASGSERPKARIDAIRIGLSVGAGTAGAVALLLAARRQWLNELGHAHQETVHTHQKEIAAVAEHDATERRITELYIKAAEQLGHEKAAVRLAGLYALERLAQNNPAHRQTVIDVLCAYLRMPIGAPTSGEDNSAGAEGVVARHADRRRAVRVDRARRALRQATADRVGEAVRVPADPGEREVRMTAQRILTRHLRRPDGVTAEQADGMDPDAAEQFWPGHRPDHSRHSMDLTDAHLIDFVLSDGHLAEARFARTAFCGDAVFGGATFTGPAGFGKATFSGDARFGNARFSGDAVFGGATFSGDAVFGGATFSGDARFDAATFFRRAVFGEATFSRDAVFGEATFSGPARFGNATFKGPARFGNARFFGDALFDDARFSGIVQFGGARVDDRMSHHRWPAGLMVVPDRERPRAGRVVHLHASEVGDPPPPPESEPSG